MSKPLSGSPPLGRSRRNTVDLGLSGIGGKSGAGARTCRHDRRWRPSRRHRDRVDRGHVRPRPEPGNPGQRVPADPGVLLRPEHGVTATIDFGCGAVSASGRCRHLERRAGTATAVEPAKVSTGPLFPALRRSFRDGTHPTAVLDIGEQNRPPSRNSDAAAGRCVLPRCC